jgi:hypothetical protein
MSEILDFQFGSEFAADMAGFRRRWLPEITRLGGLADQEIWESICCNPAENESMRMLALVMLLFRGYATGSKLPVGAAPMPEKA